MLRGEKNWNWVGWKCSKESLRGEEWEMEIRVKIFPKEITTQRKLLFNCLIGLGTWVSTDFSWEL